MTAFLDSWVRELAGGIGLAAGTLLQEDLSVLTGILLAREGRLSWTAAFAGCALGIWIGDALLYLLARRYGKSLLRYRWVARRIGPDAVRRGEEWFRIHGLWILVGARFVPGTRLPTFLAAGFLGCPPGRFLAVTGTTVAVWTAVLFLLIGGGGTGGGLPRWTPALGLLLIVGPWILGSGPGRRWLRRMADRLGRWIQWEFWPSWLFYLPVAFQYLRLALRHGGLRIPALANPGIELGGLVGESKFETLEVLQDSHPDFTARSWKLPSGPANGRWETLRTLMDSGDPGFPFVLKPDIGQRGAGFRIVRTRDEARGYLEQTQAALVVQEYLPGPLEAGIFYHRLPGEERGRIFAITEKVFPVLVGDGRTTLRELIAADPRARFLQEIYLRRHSARLDAIPAADEVIRLVEAGNHAQGCLFLDGSRLATPALLDRIEALSRSVPGFHVGRYDVRYSDPVAFGEGRGFRIVELNGAAAEATSVYDPSKRLLDAYRTLFRQWEIVFEAGAAQRRLGVRVPGYREFWSAWSRCRESLAGIPVSD
jgi:membrane protein DedA with SNARE-associated domain